jgi:zinc protease
LVEELCFVSWLLTHLKSPRRLVLILTLMMGCGVAQAAPEPLPGARTPSGWDQLRGDLPVDPDVTLGELSNGMRYVIQTSKVRPGRAAMRLVICAGSMQEAPDQEGLAHFLEHMAFHGSKNVADGEVQKTLERLGLRMGSDANASTGEDRTVYKFNLAKNDDLSIDTGLTLLREIASELNLDPALMEKERGVVLTELSINEGPVMALQNAQYARQLGKHPYSRSPGGRPDVVQSVTVQRMRDFYDAYYRPERAIMVVVGDVDPGAIEARLAAKFSDWRGRGEPGSDPAPVAARPAGEEVVAEVIEGVPVAQLQFQWFDPYRERILTKAERRRQLVENLGAATVSNRWDAVLEAAGRPAQSIGGIFQSRIPGVWNGRSMTASDVTDAVKTLTMMVTAYRQAAEFGVTQAELDHIVDVLRAQRMRAVASGQTSPPPALADAVANIASSRGTFVSPADSLAMFEAHVATITLAEVNAALKAQIAGEPTVTWRGQTAPEGGVEALRTAYANARANPVAPFAAVGEKAWPYTEFGAPGKVAERQEIAEFGVTFVRFENGVRLTVKPTTFRKNDAVLHVRFGLGQLGMPRERMDASDMGLPMWSRGGVAKLTDPEQRLILQRDAIAATPRILTDTFVVETCSSGCLTPDRVGLQLQLIAAMFTDPAWRTDDWANLMKMADEADKAVPLTARSIAASRFGALIHSGDIRWAYNTPDMRKSWTPEEAIAYMKPIVANAPLEIVVVGDVRVDEVIAATAATLGALPGRHETPEPPDLRDVKFPQPTREPIVLTHKGPADQGLAYVVWPTTDMFADLSEHRRRLVLANLITSRAMEQMREGDGKSYSPAASSASDRYLPGFGYIIAAIDCPPAELDKAVASFEAIAAQLAAEEVSADEFARVMKPMIAATKERRAQNSFWVDNLGGAQKQPRLLEFLRSIDADYAAMTPADIKATAQRWLKPQTAWKMKVVPEATAPR